MTGRLSMTAFSCSYARLIAVVIPDRLIMLIVLILMWIQIQNKDPLSSGRIYRNMTRGSFFSLSAVQQ